MEETEMDVAVGARLHVARMGSEIGVLAVLNHQPSFGFEDVLLEDEIRQGRELLKRIWRICKDEIVLNMACA